MSSSKSYFSPLSSCSPSSTLSSSYSLIATEDSCVHLFSKFTFGEELEKIQDAIQICMKEGPKWSQTMGLQFTSAPQNVKSALIPILTRIILEVHHYQDPKVDIQFIMGNLEESQPAHMVGTDMNVDLNFLIIQGSTLSTTVYHTPPLNPKTKPMNTFSLPSIEDLMDHNWMIHLFDKIQLCLLPPEVLDALPIAIHGNKLVFPGDFFTFSEPEVHKWNACFERIIIFWRSCDAKNSGIINNSIILNPWALYMMVNDSETLECALFFSLFSKWDPYSYIQPYYNQKKLKEIHLSLLNTYFTKTGLLNYCSSSSSSFSTSSISSSALSESKTKAPNSLPSISRCMGNKRGKLQGPNSPPSTVIRMRKKKK